MLRAWQTGDIDSLAEIEKQVQPLGWSKQQFRDAFQAHYSGWVYSHQHTLVGFILTTMVLDEAEILNLAVHPDQQGNGYGQRLLSHALNQLQSFNIKRIFLEVRGSNQAAIGLYEANGFTPSGCRKNYYALPNSRQREDAMLYQFVFKK